MRINSVKGIRIYLLKNKYVVVLSGMVFQRYPDHFYATALFRWMQNWYLVGQQMCHKYHSFFFFFATNSSFKHPLHL